MTKPLLAVRVRKDAARANAVWDKIANGERTLQIEFLQMEKVMEDNLVPPQECLEVLAGRYETYALRLGAPRRYLLCDLDTRGGVWTVLDIGSPANAKAEAYREACAAHGLVSPTREKHAG